MCQCCGVVDSASVCHTAPFEVAGTCAQMAQLAPAGYWPTDGMKGRVGRGRFRQDRGDCCVD